MTTSNSALLNKIKPFLTNSFRLIFLLLPIYIILSITLWGLVWSGYLPLFIQNQLVWHIYEMMFGVASAGIIGFIFTFVSEAYNDIVIISKKQIFYIVMLWLIGRIAFWMIDTLGVYVVALTNLPLLIWIVFLIAKPLIVDPLRNHISLGLILISIVIIQGWFFASLAGWVATDAMSILKVALGSFMVLELLALRRIATGTINEWLDSNNVDDTFVARPPRYNIAILCIILFTLFEFLFPYNPILGWLGFAVCAAILNTLNDFFIDEKIIIFKPYVLPIFLVLLSMAIGYGLMGFDYLYDGFNGINHFRHFLTTGVFGLSFFTVMVIISTIHTGRKLRTNKWINLAILLIVIATLLRSLMPFFPLSFMAENASFIYLSSSVIWATAFIIYLMIFSSVLSEN